jgi:cell division protein ZapA (FtsZ GTPase activity inhibitor)
VSAVNYDPEPAKAITVGLERDFVSSNSDIFGVVFDTFHDRRNSFLFLVNPKGAVRDEQTFNDSRNIVEAWDGISTVRTVQRDSSWTLEMRIPLKTLRFDASRDPQTWGINFIRRVRRVNETSYWAPLERQYRVACPDDERENLMASVAYLDQKMREIKEAGKIAGADRIAVMAALNISHEFLQQGHTTEKSTQDLGERLRKLSGKLDDTIASYRQMEM